MAKGCVPQIMSQGNGLRQIFVHAQSSGNRPGSLCNLQRMCQTRPVMISLRRKKYLRFML